MAAADVLLLDDIANGTEPVKVSLLGLRSRFDLIEPYTSPLHDFRYTNMPVLPDGLVDETDDDVGCSCFPGQCGEADNKGCDCIDEHGKSAAAVFLCGLADS